MPDHDFFISYNQAEKSWAEWIAWQLETEGYTTILQAWDFRPGGNFVLAMHDAAKKSERIILILSPTFLVAPFTQAEWASAFVNDPNSINGILLPVRVHECNPDGILKAICYVDLVDLDEIAARKTLIEGVKLGRNKPTMPPAYPRHSSIPNRPNFPGENTDTNEVIPIAKYYASDEITTEINNNYKNNKSEINDEAKELYLADVLDSFPTTNLKLTSLYMYLNLTHQDVKWTNISNEIIYNLIEKCNIPECTFDIGVTRVYRGSKDLLKLLNRLDIKYIGGLDEILQNASFSGRNLIEKVFIEFIERDLRDLVEGGPFSCTYWFSTYDIIMLLVLDSRSHRIRENPGLIKDLTIAFGMDLVMKVLFR
jgi:hypothetical protein